jgi:signal transduction histidine kinase
LVDTRWGCRSSADTAAHASGGVATGGNLEDRLGWIGLALSMSSDWLAELAPLALAIPVLGFLGRLGASPNGTRPLRPEARVTELEHELERLRAVIRQTASLNATLSYDRVLEGVLDVCAAAISNGNPEDQRLVSVLLLVAGESLEVESARGLTAADLRVRLRGEQGATERALSAGHTVALEEPSRDPELQRFAALHQCKSAVCLPLIVGLEAYGLLLFAHPNADFFSADRLELLESIAQQALVALQNAKLYLDLQQEKEHLTEAQEEARKKLARDLHDGPTQSVGAIAMRVNFARRLMERDPKAAADELYRIEELARRTTKEIRQMLFTLRPLVLETEGLVSALQHLAGKMDETHGQRVLVEADPAAVTELEIGKQGVLFYIAEEAVTNARKHAKASHIWVRLNRAGDLLRLEIQDDGVGFDVAQVEANYEQRGSLGMINLHERAELLNGLLRIDSAKGKGTRIVALVPLTPEEADRLHRPGFAA